MAKRAAETDTETQTGTGAEDSPLPAAARALGPRERRRIRTMREIQGHALRLFTEQGYGQTTIEQIAEASDISPRTFFRYFSTKEDVVFWDEYDAVVVEHLEAWPTDLPVGETFARLTREALAALYRHDPERLLARQRLMATVPEVRARFLEFARAGIGQLTTAFAAQRDLPADDLKLQLTAMAVIDIAFVAMERWQDSGGRLDLLALFDQATEAMIAGVGELRSR
jgi:AcrR family transcriptional regulator